LPGPLELILHPAADRRDGGEGLTWDWRKGRKVEKVENMSAINIKNIPDELHREAKAQAARAGMSLQAWIIEAIKEKLERGIAGVANGNR